MWAFPKLSFVSGVWVPVTSMLKIVAVKVIDVMASLMKKLAVPNDAGRGAPPDVVGTVGGFSAALDRVAVSRTLACAADAHTAANSAAQRGARGILKFLLNAMMTPPRRTVNASMCVCVQPAEKSVTLC